MKVTFCYSATLWTVLLFCTVGSKAETGVFNSALGLGAEPNKHNAPQICPDPEVIFPCVCKSYGKLSKSLDCSKVASTEQLKSIFEKPFPSNYFYGFEMRDNQHVRKLPGGIFGEKYFWFFQIFNSVLETVEPNVLLKSADTIDFIDISITYLSSFPFEELGKYKWLQTLYLGYNSLDTMPTIESQSLMEVYLDGNPIHFIPTDAFKNVPILQVFSCKNCDIGEILPGTFTTQPSLRIVHLDGNYLTNLPEGAIKLQPDESELNLRSNQLTNVSAGAFTGVSFRVDIMDNQLEQLYEDVWRSSMEAVTLFWASGNPFSCGCDIAWLLANEEFMAKLSDETCSDGRRIIDLDPLYYKEKCSTY